MAKNFSIYMSDDTLVKDLKEQAKSERRSLSAMIEIICAAYMQDKKSTKKQAAG